MQIKFDIKILIFVLFFFIFNAWDIYLLFIIFALVHELMHLIMGILVGFRPTQLTIMPFGAYINFNIDIENYNTKILKGTMCSLKKLIVIMAGPLSNIILALIFSFMSKYAIIMYINLILGIVNLFPIHPLDGGRIMKQILILVLGRRKALKYTNLISNIILIIIAIETIFFCYISKSIVAILAVIYLIIIRKKENDIYKTKKIVYELIENKKEENSNT